MSEDERNLTGTDSVDALVREAVALRRAGNTEAAACRFDAALQREPRHAGALTSYAMLRLATGDPHRAAELARRAVEVDPQRMSAHHVLGQALRSTGALREAIDALRRAAALDPEAFDVHLHLGTALAEADELADSELNLVRARSLAPQVAAVHVGLGNLYRRTHRPADALAAFERAIALEPRLAAAHNNLGSLRSDVGDAPGAVEAFERALALDPDRIAVWSNYLLALQRSDRVTDEALFEAHLAFGRQFATRVERLPPVPVGTSGDRRLRVGYVSSDFRSHAAALFLEPLLAHHDRRRFAVYCYHTAHATDEVTSRLEGMVEAFVGAAALDDPDFAARIRVDGIDILVDLNGHTAGGRLGVFAMKPAPVQVTWLGYIGTTGLTAMDYRLTDAVADPPAEPPAHADRYHVERLWRLPDCQWCYQPYHFAPPVAPLPARQRGHVTFASFAQPAKVGLAAITQWSRVLVALPKARLQVIASALPEHRAALEGVFADHGVAPTRIAWRPILSTTEYLAAYAEADIALDTTPYSGGTSTCDALWMGVPVVTLAGNRSVSRSSASILTAVGLADLVAQDDNGFVARAVALAGDLDHLAELRTGLRECMRGSPLLDAPRFARAVEAAYEAMARGPGSS
ncbi:MAG: tetratricopeptide repeat protein [Casimicrobiaceae bacterium]